MSPRWQRLKQVRWPVIQHEHEFRTMTDNHATKLLWNIRDVSHAVSLSRSTILRRLVEGTFPKPLKGRKGSPYLWDPEDVRRWARKRELR